MKTTKGMTLTEFIVAVTVFAIIVPVLSSIFIALTKEFTSYEAANSLKTINQKTLNRIFIKLSEAKRIFQNDFSGFQYLDRLNLTGCPAVLSNSSLPTIEETGTLSPGTTGFVSASVGNSLFFAKNETTEILDNISDVSGTTHTVRIDTYRFYYYYLTPEPKSIYDKQSYNLVEWSSVVYADWKQLLFIPDTTKRKNTVKALCNRNIYLGWNPSETNVNLAFSTFTPSSGEIVSIHNHCIQNSSVEKLIVFITGIMGSGYRYGISPNSNGWTRAPVPVPKYANVNNEFPSGFEVLVAGPNSGRQILVRSVLVAQGSMPNILGNDQNIICTVRDLW